ncbi:MAG: rhodanese-related sulfurtransferase [Halocynthiibacter sp.]|jgi:rhodanese-related sulfurtransferase
MLRNIRSALLIVGLCVATQATAQDVKITQDMGARTIEIAGQTITISRVQNQENVLTGEFARTSRACPPYCIEPEVVADGVQTLGELEVMDFLEAKVGQGLGILVDSRVPAWYQKGSVPGAINIPDSTLHKVNPYRGEIMKALGATEKDGVWNFDGAVELAFLTHGPWSNEASVSILSLLDAGYPAEKLKFYRGGLQSWLMLGLTVTAP